MRSRLTTLLFAALVLSGITVAADTVAYATTGRALITGAANTSARRSDLVMSEPGAALGLKVQPGSPPLYVSSATRVKNLNVDYLNGATADQLETTSISYSYAGDGRSHSGLLTLTFPGLPAGQYVVSYTAGLTSTSKPSADVPQFFQCWVSTAAAHYAAATSATAVTSSFPFMSGTDVIAVSASDAPQLQCQNVGRSFVVQVPIRVSFTRTHVTAGANPTAVDRRATPHSGR